MKTCWAVALLAGSLIVSNQSAKSERPPAEAERVLIELRVLGTHRPAPEILGQTDIVGSGGTVVDVGGAAGFAYIGTGSFAADGSSPADDLSMHYTGGSLPGPRWEKKKSELLEHSVNLWTAEVRAFPAPIGKVSIEVTWEHLCADRKGNHKRTAGDTRRIEMNEGERHVLEFTEGTSHDRFYRNLTIEVTARIEEEAALANRLLQYDVWLRHRNANGSQLTRRFRTVGKQGEEVDLRLAPIRFPVANVVTVDGRGMDAILEVLGAIRGRVRPDGSIVVRMGATRWVGVNRTGDPRSGGIGEGGNEVFQVSPGETVRLPLPSPHGTIGLGSPDLGTKIDAKEFFAGSEDELLLTVSEAR